MIRSRAPLVAALLALACCLGGCSTASRSAAPRRAGLPGVEVAGLSACGDPQRRELALESKRPLVVLVHGSYGSERDFGTLADILALHDQQTVCFRYDDRARVRSSAERLRSALSSLVRELAPSDVLVLGHSQGGLVARGALTARADTPLPSTRYRLVTVASPFGGIRAARSCGSVPYHLGSLGVTLVVCRSVSGAKWNEIHPRAAMVRRPAALAPAVREHLTIVTDERDTCRLYSTDGKRCLQDDYVFSVAEQHNAHMERDERVVQDRVVAGHSEIVGGRGDTPRKLLETLQSHGLLRATRPDEELMLEQLTAHMGW